MVSCSSWVSVVIAVITVRYMLSLDASDNFLFVYFLLLLDLSIDYLSTHSTSYLFTQRNT